MDEQHMPHRHLAEAEKQHIILLIEKSKLERERAHMVMDKGILLFFAFLVFSVVGLQNSWFARGTFNILVIAAVCVLILAITPYITATRKIEKQLDKLIESLGSRNG